ncbi:amino acid ABC transporter permease [Aquabacter spiritensis]|uniref:Glutamate/aspartate import permease protein GltK n=1 Tax=Aquabacter spiritensis TaxID=933073 RepID=A0A4R3LR21_9HYPH|nr:amino acid ABC transporter permease [Aquabacter spiritensis]TCT02953.1 glutamate/aspartate transport system permease protein [Aquabacter spiritensis]
MSGIDFSVVWQAAPYLWAGLTFTLSLTVAAFLIGISVGTLLAIAQHLQVPVLAPLARIYVAVMRSIPLIMVLFWFFFLMPVVVGYVTGSPRPVPVGAHATAYITFGLFEAAYYCEIIRAGLRAVPRGQYEACRAMSMSPFLTYRLVILPQVLRAVGPIVLNQTIVLFQDTSLVYVLSLTDLLGAAAKMAQINGRLVEMYLAAALIYLVISTLASQIVTMLKRRSWR